MKRVVEIWFTTFALAVAAIILICICRQFGTHITPWAVLILALAVVALILWLMRPPAWRHCRGCGRYWHVDGKIVTGLMPEECEGVCQPETCRDCDTAKERFYHAE